MCAGICRTAPSAYPLSRCSYTICIGRRSQHAGSEDVLSIQKQIQLLLTHLPTYLGTQDLSMTHPIPTLTRARPGPMEDPPYHPIPPQHTLAEPRRWAGRSVSPTPPGPVPQPGGFPVPRPHPHPTRRQAGTTELCSPPAIPSPTQRWAAGTAASPRAQFPDPTPPCPSALRACRAVQCCHVLRVLCVLRVVQCWRVVSCVSCAVTADA